MMAPSYNFAIVRFAPDELRGERLNVGAIVLKDDGIDIRIARNLEKVRSMSAAVDKQSLIDLLSNLKGVDESARKNGINNVQARIKMLSRIGPLVTENAGAFVAESNLAYESRIDSILKRLVEPEPRSKQKQEKRTRLFSQLKQAFKRERVLANKDEGLESHRVVPAYEIDEGLVADLVLQNGMYHVVETVDASGGESTFRKAVAEIAISALVIERARMIFGEKQTKAKLVYSTSSALEKLAQPSLDAAAHQGAELINWASADQRRLLIDTISSMAKPLEPKKKKKFVATTEGGLFH